MSVQCCVHVSVYSIQVVPLTHVLSLQLLASLCGSCSARRLIAGLSPRVHSCHWRTLSQRRRTSHSTRRGASGGVMLAQRRRRWASVTPTLCQCLIRDHSPLSAQYTRRRRRWRRRAGGGPQGRAARVGCPHPPFSYPGLVDQSARAVRRLAGRGPPGGGGGGWRHWSNVLNPETPPRVRRRRRRRAQGFCTRIQSTLDT